MSTETSSSVPQKVNLRDYWWVLVKQRWIVITFLLVVVTTVAIYSLTMIPIYMATAQILIEKTNPNILSIQELVVMDLQVPISTRPSIKFSNPVLLPRR